MGSVICHLGPQLDDHRLRRVLDTCNDEGLGGGVELDFARVARGTEMQHAGFQAEDRFRELRTELGSDHH